MMRALSNLCFGLALGSALLLKLCAIQDELIWYSLSCVAVTAILTNLMRVRSIGIAGICGLSIVYSNLNGNLLPGILLTTLTAALLVAAIVLAICADISTPSRDEQGGDKQHEA